MNVASLLRQELAKRTRANPAYSMRSLARSLEMSPSQLCEILGGRKKMSDKTQSRIAKKLGWGARKTNRKEPGELRQFTWTHLAILELSTHQKVTNDPARIGRRLGISTSNAKLAIEDLVCHDFLQVKNGTLMPIPDRLFFGNGTPSETIRNFHKDALQLAARQIDLTNFEDREFSYSIVGLSPEQVQGFRRRIREVVEEFSDIANGETKQARDIFGFGIQLYKISNEEVGEK